MVENNNINNVDIRKIDNTGHQTNSFAVNSKAAADANCETPQGEPSIVQYPEATKVMAQIITPTPSSFPPMPTPTPATGNFGGGFASFTKQLNPAINNPPVVTKTATVTLTGSASPDNWDNINARLKRGDNDTNLALPSRVFGPYPQTLFLGCSVVGLNVSLGWGNQPAQLSVTLAEDTSPHYVCTQDGGRYKEKALAAYNTPNHYYNVIKAQSDANGVMENVTTYFNRVKDFVDINGNVIVPGKVYYAYNESTKAYEQRYWLGPDPGFLGAKNHLKDGSIQWSYTDPITGKFEPSGIPIDILGCPVFFKIDDFVFCGIVKNWRASNSGTGGIQYTVDIEGPNELVNQTQLILDNYAGTIFTKAFNIRDSLTTDRYSDRAAISGPYNNPRDPQIPLTSYKGNIAVDGNLPNVINVYGFLEAAAPGGFGGANVNDAGIKTNLVYQALNFLLSFPDPQVNSYLPGETSRNMFNPYGALVGRTPMSASPKDTSQLANYRIFTLSNSPTVQDKVYTNPAPALNAVSFSSASQSQESGGGTGNPAITYPKVLPPRQNEGLTGNVVNGTLLGPRAVESRIKPGVVGDIFDNKPMTGDGYNDTTGFTNIGNTVKIFSFGLIPPDDVSFSTGNKDTANETNNKQLYYLDLSELPILSNQLRTEVAGGGIKDLNSFIYDVCSNAGVDFFYELLYLKIVDGMPPQKFIKVRTVSRRVQPSDRAVADYIAKLREWKVPVSSVSLGKEFNSQSKPRSMIVGAKQRRLFQTKNWSISYRSSSLIYSLVLDKFINFQEADYSHVKNHNYFRIPNPGSIREPPAIANPRLRSTRINEIKQDTPAYYEIDSNWSDESSDREKFPHKGNYFQAGPNTNNSSDLAPAVVPIARIGDGKNYQRNSDGDRSNVYIKNLLTSIFSWAIPGFQTKRNRSLNARNHSVDNTYATGPININPSTSLTILGNTIADQAKSLIDSVGSEYMSNQFISKILNQFNPMPLAQQTTNDRFYPIMYNSVCPYFGSIDYIAGSATYNLSDKTKKPRPVWFDMWTNQLLIIFNAKELPQTKMELIGLYNNGNFVVTESELRAALSGFETWMQYMQGKIYKPDIFFMIKNALCGDTQIPKPTPEPPKPPNPTPDKRKGPDSDFGANSNNGQGPVDQGRILPKLPNINIQFNDNDWDACRIFSQIFRISSSWNQVKSSIGASTGAEGRPAGLHSSITYDLKQIHGFFSDIASNYYGKKFMVRIPMVLSYKDREILENFDPRPTPTPLPTASAPNTLPEGNPPFGRPANTGSGAENRTFSTNQIDLSSDASKPQYIAEGSGKIYSNYNICPEGAWEEYGNCIDDSIMIGSYQASVFQDDKGLIQPILGYVADDKFDHDAYLICRNVKATSADMVKNGSVFHYYEMLKRANMYHGHSRYTQFQKSSS